MTEHKELLKELQESKKANATISTVAIKKREHLTEFTTLKSEKQIQEDKRAVVKQQRSYMIRTNATNTKKYDVANTTIAVIDDKIVQINTKIMNDLTQTFLQRIAQYEKFNVKSIQNAFQIWGCNYGDFPRKSLELISFDVTLQQKNESDADFATRRNTEIQKAHELKKQLLRVNLLENDSRKKLYEFTKI